MREHSEVVSFKVCCHCQSQEEISKQWHGQINLQELYKRFGKTLEEELRKQHEENATLIDDLNNQIFVLKNTISKLQMRNKRDGESERQLRKQYNLLLQKFKETETKVIREVEVIQKIKQVPVEANFSEFEEQIKRLKLRSDQVNRQTCKVQMEKNIVQVQNQRLNDQIEKINKLVAKLKDQIEDLKSKCRQNDRMIEKLNQQNSFLKSNKQVVVQTKHIFPEFICPEKFKTQTKYQTIYIEKPVQKLVFVDVEKRVKQFIQPERPLVNRIIRCEQNKKCKCEQEQYKSEKYQKQNAQIQYLTNTVDLLQNNITQYKSQRQKLVDVIESKNSELNNLQTRMKLIGCGFSRPTPSNFNYEGSNVNVTVTKLKEEEKEKPVSYKQTAIKSQKPSKKQL